MRLRRAANYRPAVGGFSQPRTQLLSISVEPSRSSAACRVPVSHQRHDLKRPVGRHAALATLSGGVMQLVDRISDGRSIWQIESLVVVAAVSCG